MMSIFIALAVSLLLNEKLEVRNEKYDCSQASTTACKSNHISHHSPFTPHLSPLTSHLEIVFTGDLLLDRGVRRAIERNGIDHLFTPQMDSLLLGSDVVVANLECPATKIKAPVFKRFIFRGEPEWLPALRRHGITHLNLANNHSMDQGRDGLADTWRNIAEAGMTVVGAGPDMASAAQPVLLATIGTHGSRHSEALGAHASQGADSISVWLLTSVRLTLENFPYLVDRPCVSQEPMDSLIARVRRLRGRQSVVIVSLHWGAEHTTKPVASQRLDAHRLIDAGADAVICHHTHTMQTVETYHGKPIYYSIGNFIFDQPKPLNSEACIVKLTVTPDTVVAASIPIEIRNCVPHVSPASIR